MLDLQNLSLGYLTQEEISPKGNVDREGCVYTHNYGRVIKSLE